MDAAVALSEQALGQLLAASLSGGLFVLAVALLCRLAPRLPAALRAALYWAACLKLLAGLIGIAPIELPLLPPAAPPAFASPIAPADVAVSVSAFTAAPAPPAPASRWPLLLAGLWLAGIAVHGAFLLRELRQARRVIRRSIAAPAGFLGPIFAPLCRRLGVRRVGPVLLSDDIRTPQVVGLLRPTVVLPRHAVERLGPEELEMALCHELLHVKRRDLWLGWVPALAERLFFFHPLAALAAREYALAREAACDAGVLDALGTAPRAYGQLLLQIATVRRPSGVLALGVAPTRKNLQRRLEMLHTAVDSKRRRPLWLFLLGAATLVGLVPLRLVARADVPAAVQVAVAPVPVVTVPEVPRVADVAPIAAVPAVSAVRIAVAPSPRPEPSAGVHSARQVSVSNDSTGDSVVIKSGDDTVMIGHSSLSGKRRLKAQGDSIWFQRGGKEYLIRDAATVKAAQALFAQQTERGKKQAELGEQQAKLGAEQAALGGKQAALGAKQAALGAQQAALALKSGDGAEKRQDELGAQQDQLGKQQDELGAQQDALGKKQDELGKRQDELGREQDRIAGEAERKLKPLLDEAIRKGLAEEVK